MHLLEFINFEIKPTEECFLVKPIRDLYNKDKTKNKEKFMQQLAILYYMVDPRSSYNYIVNEEDRFKTILIEQGLEENYKITPDLKKAMDAYRQHVITTSYLLLQDTKLAIDKVRAFLRDVDLTLTDDKGKPVYTINSITTAIKQVPQLAKDLMETEKVISKEIEEQGRARGGSSKTLADDGLEAFI